MQISNQQDEDLLTEKEIENVNKFARIEGSNTRKIRTHINNLGGLKMENSIFTVASLTLDGWTFYANDTPPAEYEAFLKNIERIKAEGGDTTQAFLPADEERIKTDDALYKLIAETKVRNQQSEHHFTIYFDWAYAGANRMVLTCDGEWICVDQSLGSLMAVADRLLATENSGSFDRIKKESLALMWLTDKCLFCKEQQ